MTEPTQSPATPPLPKRRRWMLWLGVLLALSLAANLTLVGYVLGSQGKRHFRADISPGQLGHFMRQQSSQRREELAPLSRQYRKELRRAMRELSKARRALHQAVRTEPMDRGAVEAAMLAVDQALLRSSQVHHQTLLPVLEAMSAMERAAFIESRRRPRHRSGRPYRSGRMD